MTGLPGERPGPTFSVVNPLVGLAVGLTGFRECTLSPNQAGVSSETGWVVCTEPAPKERRRPKRRRRIGEQMIEYLSQDWLDKGRELSQKFPEHVGEAVRVQTF